jgi:hypothetical protein
MNTLKKKGMLGGILLLSTLLILSVAAVYAGNINSAAILTDPQNGSMFNQKSLTDPDFNPNNPPDPPPGVAGPAIKLNDTSKLIAAREFVNSLTDKQRASLKQLLDTSQSLAPSISAADIKALSTKAPNLNKESVNLAKLAKWSQAMKQGMAKILTADQYKVFEASLLPAPDTQPLAGIEANQSYCYYAYYYGYYSNLYSYYFYLYAYYSYAYENDPYGYGVYEMGYQSYLTSYYGYIYSSYAYSYYYNYTYGYYGYYYLKHAQGYQYWGGYGGLAYVQYSWLGSSSYAYYAYYYGYYAYYYNGLNSSTNASSYAYSYCY